ncbi:MAG: 3-isopropylmalate dehydratase small subunit, partial [Burkholderiales bacterium]
VLPQPEVDTLMRKAQQVSGYQASVDLVRMQLQDASGRCISFGIDGFTRRCLLEGLDTIGLTLQNESIIADYEARHREEVPGAAR